MFCFCIKPKLDRFDKSATLDFGINCVDIVDIHTLKQKDVKKVFSNEKFSKLKEEDFKYKLKANIIHGDIDALGWERIFEYLKQAMVENKTKELQYKIIMRYVPTNYLLHKMKIVPSQLCTFCYQEPETIEHLFFNCNVVKNMWLRIYNEWNIITGTDNTPTISFCVLRHSDVEPTNVSTALYSLSLWVKSFIMYCKYNNTDLLYNLFISMYKTRVDILGNSFDNDVYRNLKDYFQRSADRLLTNESIG